MQEAAERLGSSQAPRNANDAFLQPSNSSLYKSSRCEAFRATQSETYSTGPSESQPASSNATPKGLLCTTGQAPVRSFDADRCNLYAFNLQMLSAA